ncbi:MAG: T9SS type A sorting domain-containing protein [Sphingobacteriales bacterium]|nr:MAG: T9SS type A sorting domain-containing protein [Sphingobacteriales bacterium]
MSTGPGYEADAFVAKWDSAGNYIWAKRIGSEANEVPVSITVDQNGAPSIAGIFGTGNLPLATTDFDPGPGIFNLTTTSASAPFICRLTTAGDFSWAQTINAFGSARGVTTDSKGNVYFGGNLGGNGFVRKLDSLGSPIWAIGIGGSGDDGINWLGSDMWDNVYVFGGYQYTVDFDPGPDTVSANGGLGSPYLLKLGTETVATAVADPGNNTAGYVLYPNPATTSFSLSGLQPGQQLILTDPAGRMLYQWEVTSQQSYNITGLTSGYYLLHVRDAHNKLSKTIGLIKR